MTQVFKFWTEEKVKQLDPESAHLYYLTCLVERKEVAIVYNPESVIIVEKGPIKDRRTWDGETTSETKYTEQTKDWDKITELEEAGWELSWNYLFRRTQAGLFCSEKREEQPVPYKEITTVAKIPNLDKSLFQKVRLKNRDGAVLTEGWVRVDD